MNSLKFTGHIPGLDVLRGMAIAMVVIYHGMFGRVPASQFSGWISVADYVTAWGAGGVHLFFVLSGFLITGIIIDGRGSCTLEFFRRFYKRRALRILPAYFLLLIILKLLDIISWKFMMAAALFMANMASAVGARSSEFGPLWSLAVEEQFYLIWPWLARRFALRKLAILIVILSIVLLLSEMVIAFHSPTVDTKTKLWSNAPWLLTGALIAIGLRDGFIRRDNLSRIIAGCLVGALITSPIVYLVDFCNVDFLAPILRLPFVFIFVAMLLWAIQSNSDDARPQGLLARGFAFLGYLSYGLYLVHQLIFILFERSFDGTWIVAHDFGALVVSMLICFSISVAVAYISRRYFEEFFLTVK